MIELLESGALIAGLLVFLAVGITAAAGLVSLAGFLLFEACKYFIKAGIIETYNVASINYYMAVMVKLGRKGLLKHAEDAKKEQPHDSE